MTLISALRSLAAEQDCCLCGCAAEAPVCAACAAAFARLPTATCPICALPSAPDAACGRCLTALPHYDATIAARAYGPPPDQALLAFKYRHALGLARILSGLLEGALAEPPGSGPNLRSGAGAQPDVSIPLPLAAARLSERSFNQAQELARPIASRRNIPLDARGIRRIRMQPPSRRVARGRCRRCDNHRRNA